MSDEESLSSVLAWWGAFWNPDQDKMRAELVALLRGDIPITREARDNLADLFDKSAASMYVADFKRRRGRPKRANTNALSIFLFIDEATELGEKKEAAVRRAMEHWGISRAKVFEALGEIGERLDADPESQRRLAQIRKSRKRGDYSGPLFCCAPSIKGIDR